MPTDDAAHSAAPVVEAALLTALQGTRAMRWVVGFSGGGDSTALLLAARNVLQRLSQSARAAVVAPNVLDGAQVPKLIALHVQHGLHPDADRWSALARQNALGFGAAFAELRAHVDGHGEAAARAARYAAFERFLAPRDLLLLAHHRDDDAETVLMDVLRGSGVRAMPSARPVGAARLLRPLLDVSRRELLAYMEGLDVRVVDDPSNTDPGVSRSLLRQSVLPLVEAVWPGVALRLQQLARAQSGRDCTLQLLLDALLRSAVDAQGGLRLTVLRSQPLPIAQALLEAWLRPQTGRLAGRHLLELLRQLLTIQEPAGLSAQVRGRPLRYLRDVVYLLAASAADPMSNLQSANRRADRLTDRPTGQHSRATAWDGTRPLDTPVGVLRRSPVGPGYQQSMRWPAAAVSVQLRRGGERLRLRDDGPSRTVKSLLREAGAPVWLRARWPLVYLGDELIAVPGVAVNANWSAGPGDAAYVLKLEPP